MPEHNLVCFNLFDLGLTTFYISMKQVCSGVGTAFPHFFGCGNGVSTPVACRGLAMPGATAWLDAPLPSSSIEQWRMVVIVIGYTLFVTSQYDVSFTFANHCFGEVCWHSMHIKGAGAAVGMQSRRHGGLAPQTKLQDPSNWIMKPYKSVEFLSNFRISSPLNRHKAPLFKTFWRRFCTEGEAIKQLRALETYKKNHYQLCLFRFINNVDLKNNNRNDRKLFWVFWVPEKLQ